MSDLNGLREQIKANIRVLHPHHQNLEIIIGVNPMAQAANPLEIPTLELEKVFQMTGIDPMGPKSFNVCAKVIDTSTKNVLAESSPVLMKGSDGLPGTMQEAMVDLLFTTGQRIELQLSEEKK